MAAEKKQQKEPGFESLEKKLDRLIELQEQQIRLLDLMTQDRCTCKKHRKEKKVKNPDKHEKEKEPKAEKKQKKDKK